MQLLSQWAGTPQGFLQLFTTTLLIFTKVWSSLVQGYTVIPFQCCPWTQVAKSLGGGRDCRAGWYTEGLDIIFLNILELLPSVILFSLLNYCYLDVFLLCNVYITLLFVYMLYSTFMFSLFQCFAVLDFWETGWTWISRHSELSED